MIINKKFKDRDVIKQPSFKKTYVDFLNITKYVYLLALQSNILHIKTRTVTPRRIATSVFLQKILTSISE